MFDAIAPRYDLVNRVMTLGMDRGWRRQAVDRLELAPGSLVLDIACGTGDFCNELIHRGIHAVGIDFSPGMLRSAKTPAPLLAADALALPVKRGAADGVTCGFALRNVANLRTLFGQMSYALRPGGRFAILEVDEPESAIPHFFHRLYFHQVVPLIGGAISDRRAYRYLPASTSYLPPPSEILEMLKDAGFNELARVQLGMGAVQIISGTRI